jgi:pyruvate kinase
VCRAITELKDRNYLEGGQLVAIVQSGRQPIWRTTSTHAIQVRAVPKDVVAEESDADDVYPVDEQWAGP